MEQIPLTQATRTLHIQVLRHNPADPASVSGTGGTSVSYTLGGLLPGTTIHYRVLTGH